MTRHPFIFLRVRRSAGSGLVTAIFLLVVLAGLAVAMVTLFTTQQASAALDEQGSRAYQAARAGIEWGLFQQHKNNCAASTTFALPAGTSLSGFTVTVTCTQLAGSNALLDRWVIRANACTQPNPTSGTCPNQTNNPDYVARQLEVEI
jgi:MSHA biogenesis protein MshP